MSLFGDSDSDSLTPSSRPKPSTSLFDDRPPSTSLFADDDDASAARSPWALPTPRKARTRTSLIRSLLPASEVPGAYVDAYDSLIAAGETEGGGVSVDAVRRRVLGESGLDGETQGRIEEVVGFKGLEREGTGVGRGEFNVLVALVGLAGEGEEVSLDGVDERRKDLPVPSLPLLGQTAHHEDKKEAAQTAHVQHPPSPPTPQRPRQNTASTTTTSQQPSTPSRSRAPMRKQSFGDPEADPWASPDLHRGHDHSNYTSVPSQQSNGLHGPAPAGRTTSQFTTPEERMGPTSTAEPSVPRPSTLGSEGGWGSFNPSADTPFSGPSGLGPSPFGEPSSTGPSGAPTNLAQSLGIHNPPPLPQGVEETVTVTTIAEKEGMFMFQHRNYEIASARRNVKVIRRYSDFVWLLDCLHKRYPFRQLPLLPPKRVAINGNYLAADASFVEKRRRGLSRFVNALVRHPVLSQEQLVVMFLTVPTELAVWRKQASISVQEEFTGKPLPPDLEDSLPKTLPDLFDTVRSGIRRSAEVYINLCNMMERLSRRNEGMAAEYLRFATALYTVAEASRDTYACDTSDVPALNSGLEATAKHLEQSRALLEDEAKGWEEGVLEDLKRQRDSLVSMRDLFDRRDKYARDNIPALEKRIKNNEAKLEVIRNRPEGVGKPGEAEKVEEAIVRDKESIVQQHARGVFIKECIRDELLFFQQSQYHVSRLHQDWAQERVKYAELQADNWRALSEEVEGMPMAD